jgi:hypothetical protein
MSTGQGVGLQAGPSLVKRALVVAGCGMLTVTVSACESTEQESAKLGREAAKSSTGGQAAAPKLGAINHSVTVSDVTLLSGEGRSAVAVRLTSKSARAQLDVPLDLEVRAGGKTLYSNRTGGLEASLQSIALLPAHASVWWVDDQVSRISGKPAVSVVVGSGRSARAQASPAASSLRTGEQSGISVVSGKLLVGGGHRPRGGAAVYVVALEGARVVAAGRAVVAKLGGHASAPFQAFLVGSPAGAKIEASVG